MRMWLPTAVILMVLASLGWEAIKQRIWPSDPLAESLRGPVAVTLSHGAGFDVMRPQGFSVRSTDQGYVFSEDRNLRTPLSVAIGRGTITVAESFAERELPAGRLRYWLEEQQAGSGGPLWRLVGRLETVRGALAVEAAQQREEGAPTFARAWVIFESIRVP